MSFPSGAKSPIDPFSISADNHNSLDISLVAVFQTSFYLSQDPVHIGDSAASNLRCLALELQKRFRICFGFILEFTFL